jgi:hypothetical protein
MRSPHLPWRAGLAGAALLLLVGAACAHMPAPVRASTPAEAAVNQVFELKVVADAGAQIHAEFIAPSGARVRAEAFEKGGGQVVRYRPREPGRHRWRVLAGDGDAPVEVAQGELRAVDRGLQGQVVVHGAALQTEDGRPFHPLGENRFNVYDPSWSDGLSPEGYVARMAADGMNTIRIFVFSACGRPGYEQKPGCLEPSLGRFDEAAARQYDAVFEAAERHGVKVVLAPFAIGFTPGDAWKGWQENPYAAARGGPAAGPDDFFTDPKAREAALRRLRYVIARWSASPALLSIDLLNEPEWDGRIPERLWIPWAEDLARVWRAEDAYGHPVTAGPVGLHANIEQDERGWWASSACDVVQWHRYGREVYEVHALAAALVDTIRDTARYGKPVLLGEFAYGGEPKPAYDHTHVGIWASTFAGAGVLAHSAPQFEIDSDEPMTAERGRHFRTLAGVLRSAERRGALSPASDPATTVPGLRALALASDRAVALWLLAPETGYGAPVSGGKVTLHALPLARWRIRWLDDVTGAELRVDERTAGGEVVLDVPPFARHVAAVAERLDGAASPAVQARAAASDRRR